MLPNLIEEIFKMSPVQTAWQVKKQDMNILNIELKTNPLAVVTIWNVVPLNIFRVPFLSLSWPQAYRNGSLKEKGFWYGGHNFWASLCFLEIPISAFLPA